MDSQIDTTGTSVVALNSGGDIFIMQGAALIGSAGTTRLAAGTILEVTASTTLTQPLVLDGAVTFDIPAGDVLVDTAPIADGGSPGTLFVTGGGVLELAADGSYTGGSMIGGGSTLVLAAADPAGSGAIGFDGPGALLIEPGADPATLNVGPGQSVINSGTVVGTSSAATHTAGGTAAAVTGGTLTNTGSIIGGSAGGDANGGAGIAISGGTLITSGLVAGGRGGGQISQTSGSGGAGIAVTGGTIDNSGTVRGGDGGPSGGYDPGVGGSGVEMTGGTFTNFGLVTGGTANSSYVSGDAGAGLTLDQGVFINAGSIIGGIGDNAGSGGVGVVISDGTLITSGLVAGSTGGYSTGTSGSGGAAIAVTGGTIDNTGTVAGGDGNGTPGVGRAGGGGSGVAMTGGTFLNSGFITGGAAGNTYDGAAGGAGLTLDQGLFINEGTLQEGGGDYPTKAAFVSAGTLVDSGTIIGGGGYDSEGIQIAGGTVLVSGLVVGDRSPGALISGGTLFETGTIIGGSGGTAGSGGEGIQFAGGTVIVSGLVVGGVSETGSDLQLVVLPGAQFTGDVGASGSNDGIVLGGTVAGTFSAIGGGFASIVFDPGSDWVLAGSAEALESAGTIDGFTPNETIDLTGAGLDTTALLQPGNVLVLSGNSVTSTLTLSPSTDYSHATFVLTPDGNGGTDLNVLDLGYASGEQVSVNGSVLTVTAGTVSQTLTLAVAPGVSLAATSNGSGGAVIAAPTAPVTSVAGLNAAIELEPDLASGTQTITLGANISLGTTPLEAFNLKSGLTVDLIGNGFTLDGGGTQRGLFVYAGAVSINDLAINDMLAQGGAGASGGGGGGGGGLGGGLFIGANVAGDPGSVTLNAVTFSDDAGEGGGGGNGGYTGGGGGGLGGAGGSGSTGGGGGGGIGGAGGANGVQPAPGIVPNINGGGGGGGARSGGGVGGGGAVSTNNGAAGGLGGFGGGGGAGEAASGSGGAGGGGGFGGGGGGDVPYGTPGRGGNGGFGGGGGGTNEGTVGQGGFGGGEGHAIGSASSGGGGGGGGLGAGGDIFIQQGASLTIGAGILGTGTVAVGVGGTDATGAGAGANGQAYGDGLFIQGNQAVTMAPGAGQTLTLAGVIADETGARDPSGQTGAGTLVMDGLGTLQLDADNTYHANTGGIADNDSIVAGFTGGIDINGGVVELQAAGAAGSGTITFGTSISAELLVDAAALPATGQVFGNTVGNFAAGDTIVLTGATGLSYNATADQLSYTAAGAGSSFTLDGAYGSNVVITGDTITALCFLPGTMIRTPSGNRPVERLAVGDLVTTWAGAMRPITWIGKGHVLATPGRRNAATPVIVARNALAPGVPGADLRVTKGHSLLIDDVLIPVEFLVNHRSITWDDRARQVHLYHIELDAHDILIANDAPAESYRDDGNRWLFQNANSGWDQTVKPPCRPVLTGGPIVDAAWRRLLDRAGPRPGLPLTADPDLHLLLDGVRLNPAERQDSAYVFRLPATPRTVRLVSRAVSPAELGLSRDPRVLGVAVAKLEAWQNGRFRVLQASDPLLSTGFHAWEQDGDIRWTDGDAPLPPGLFEGFNGVVELRVGIGGTTTYPELEEAA